MSDTTGSLRFRVDQFDRLMTPLGITSTTDQATFLGLSKATVSKVRRGVQRPGNRFIRRVRAALPDVPFEQLFELVDGESVDRGAAA